MTHPVYLHTARRLHRLDCRCEPCNPPAPSVPRRRSAATTAAIQLAAGIAIGQLLTIALDHVAGLPGGSVFGL